MQCDTGCSDCCHARLIDHRASRRRRSRARSRRWPAEQRAALAANVAAASTDRCAALDADGPLPDLRRAPARVPLARRADPAARGLAAGRAVRASATSPRRARRGRSRLHPRSADAVGDRRSRSTATRRRRHAHRPRDLLETARFRGRCLTSLSRRARPSRASTRAEVAVFTAARRRRLHDARLHDASTTHTQKLDACCQYGCDVDLLERDAILARAERDPAGARAPRSRACRGSTRASPSTIPICRRARSCARPSTTTAACSSSHDKRGCAIHRASLEQGWDFRGVKPSDLPAVPAVVRRGRDLVATTTSTTRARIRPMRRRCTASRAMRSPTSSAPSSCARWMRPRRACSREQLAQLEGRVAQRGAFCWRASTTFLRVALPLGARIGGAADAHDRAGQLDDADRRSSSPAAPADRSRSTASAHRAARGSRSRGCAGVPNWSCQYAVCSARPFSGEKNSVHGTVATEYGSSPLRPFMSASDSLSQIR